MFRILQRLLAALPDGLSAAVFLRAWIDPASVGYDKTKNLMLVMLFEFIAMHSGAIVGSIVMSDMPLWRRIGMMCFLSAAYLVFVLAFAYAFADTWPIWVFGWLFLCRFWYLLVNRTTSAETAQRMQTSWAISGMAYLSGAFLTVFVPLPRLGMTPDAVAALQLPPNMSGAWVDRPWIVLAFGTYYFGVLAWSKLADVVLPAKALPNSAAQLADAPADAASTLPPNTDAQREAMIAAAQRRHERRHGK